MRTKLRDAAERNGIKPERAVTWGSRVVHQADPLVSQTRGPTSRLVHGTYYFNYEWGYQAIYTVKMGRNGTQESPGKNEDKNHVACEAVTTPFALGNMRSERERRASGERDELKSSTRCNQ